MTRDGGDEATDPIARELAGLTGETITAATRVALEERLDRVRAQARIGVPVALLGIIARGRVRSLLDPRAVEEIMGYGPDGFPG